MKILGIDEAGRGPFIGPMYIAGFLLDESFLNKLTELGVKDSKLLSKNRRESIYLSLIKIGKYKLIDVQPKEIELMSKIGINLNKLEMIKMSEIVNELKPDVVYIDCPSTNTKKFVEEFKILLKNKNLKIIAEHKADYKYPIVGAASILAKVNRDNFIKNLHKEIGYFGSGYLTDEDTINFLKNNFSKIKDHPQIRKTWETYNTLLKEKEQKSLNSFFFK